jgi:endothelin-converting enzyme/putative endopeptidase
MGLRVMLWTATALAALLPAQLAWAAEKADIGTWGVDTATLSKTVRPNDDFYRYVNETWLKSAKIPAGLSGTDSFTEVFLSTEQRVAGIIKEAREGNDAPGTPEQLIAHGEAQCAGHDADRQHACHHRRPENARGTGPRHGHALDGRHDLQRHRRGFQ